MASAYVLPSDRGSHVYGHHGHAHSRSHQHSLRSERPSSWLSQINEAALKKTPSVNSLRGQSLSEIQLHTDSQALSADSFEPNEPPRKMHNSGSKGRPRGDSDLMRPSQRRRATSNAYGIPPAPETPVKSGPWLTAREALTAVLIPLPYLFASLAYHHTVPTNAGKPPSPFDRLVDPAPEAGDAPVASVPELVGPSALLQACCLASGTLLLAGFIGALNPSERMLDRRKRDLGSNDAKSNGEFGLVTKDSIPRIVARLLSVGLPYYSAMQLGGARTSFVLLTTIGSGLTSLNISPLQSNLFQSWKRIASARKLTCTVLLLSFMLDLTGLARGIGTQNLLLGHLSLALSVLVFPPPLSGTGMSALSRARSASTASTSTAHALYDNPKAYAQGFAIESLNPLVASMDNVKLTLIAGGLLSMATVAYALFVATSPSLSYSTIMFTTFAMSSALGFLFFSSPSSLRSPYKGGVAIGYAVTICFGYLLHSDAWKGFMALGVLSCLSYMAVWSDTAPPSQSTKVDHHSHKHHHDNKSHLHSHSAISGYLIALCTPGTIMHSVLIEKDSRRIAYFGCLNLGFMVVQFFYGFASGSLGLLTDSIHMLFDCLGLAVGLAAAVMTKRPPNTRFPYGYGKIDTLSGFANGIFLMLVSVEIVFDAFEKLYEGHEMHRLNELLIVSVLGLIVNIVGLTAFGHAHHGHDHDHSHGEHSHDNENMHGIFLHILADTLGSAAVIVSTILAKWTGWAGWDPIASTIIAVLIALSAYPLVKSSGMRLLLSLPADVEYKMRTTLQEINSLKGIVGYTVPKFWMEDAGAAHAHGHSHSHAHDDHSLNGHANGHVHETEHTHCNDHKHDHDHDHAHDHDHDHDHGHHSHGRSRSRSHGHSHSHSHGHSHDHQHQAKVLGVIHIIASRSADVEDVQERAVQFFKGRGMDIVVHVEREGEGWCWCGAGTKVGG